MGIGNILYKFSIKFLAFSFLLSVGLDCFASEGHADEKFNPADLILHHVTDAHEWSFAHGKDGKSYGLYLPIIAYTPDKGIKVFSSKHLYHAQEQCSSKLEDGNVVSGGAYEGFFLAHEHLYRCDGGKVTDLSITKNVASMFISVIVLLALFSSVAGAYKKRGGQKPTGLQSFLEPIILFVRDEIAKPNIGPKYERYLPYLLTVFFFIWVNNLLGLIPGGANLTGNIAVTLTLAVFTFVITTVSGNKDYWKHVYNTPGVPWWLKFPLPLMPLVEFAGLFTKPFSLMIRLFANITAGHIIILSLLSLIFIFQSYVIGIFSSLFVVVISFLELFVAALQAYVFTLLTAMYFGGAVAEHEHEHEHHPEHGEHGTQYEHEYGQEDKGAKAELSPALQV